MRGSVRLTQPTIGDAEVRAASAVLMSGDLVQGSEVAAFEAELASTLEGHECIATSSGTTALQLALLAIGVQPGDEVVVPSFTFVATVNAVRLAGAVPVFADVDVRGCIDPASVAACLTSRTTAVIAVHLYGNPVDFDGLARVCAAARVAIVEDACQAQGARHRGRPVGTLGAAAAFSFYPSKNMTTGEGGAVVTADRATARRVRLLRNHGLVDANHLELTGTNARMTDIAAAIGRVQLTRLPHALAARARIAAAYSAALCGVELPTTAEEHASAWNLYTVQIARDRDGVAARLQSLGVETRVYYRTPVHRLGVQPPAVELPVTDRLADQVLTLPLHPSLSDDDVQTVTSALLDALP